MSPTHTVISLENVVVSFQQRRGFRHTRFAALHEVSMQLMHGEKLGVIGSNGAGKSTLLKVLAGVLSPDSGVIRRDHGSCQLLALGTGFMPNLTGRENAVLNGLLYGLSRREVVSRLEDIKDFSELGDFFDQPVKTYSSGMRSRLGFATALQLRPDVMLIDETLAVGDAGFMAKSLAALRKRIAEGSTVVVVSHSQRMISDICDRVLWMDHGRIRAAGRPEEILRQYGEASLAARAATPVMPDPP